MDPNHTENAQTPEQSPIVAQPAPQPPSNKKLIIGIAIGLGALLLVLIVLVAILITQRSGNTGNNDQANSSQGSGDNKSDKDERKVAKSVTLASSPSLQVTIYEPRQTGTNTTIDYTSKNICKSSCSAQEYASGYYLGAFNDGSAYLLDAESGTKFNPIIDNNNKPLATENCSAFLTAGQSLDCFIAFTKVPNGTSFSFVVRGLKVDGLKAQ